MLLYFELFVLISLKLVCLFVWVVGWNKQNSTYVYNNWSARSACAALGWLRILIWRKSGFCLFWNINPWTKVVIKRRRLWKDSTKYTNFKQCNSMAANCLCTQTVQGCVHVYTVQGCIHVYTVQGSVQVYHKQYKVHPDFPIIHALKNLGKVQNRKY